MNRVIKDLKVILDEQSSEQFGELVTKMAKVETTMAQFPDLVPLDFFLDYSGLVSSFYNMYTSFIRKQKGISYVSLTNRLERLEEISAIMRNKENDHVKIMGNKLKGIYMKFSNITKGLTVGMLK